MIPVLLQRPPLLVDSRASVPCSFEVCSQFFCNVRCGWSIHVPLVSRSFALLCLSAFLERAIRLVGSRITFALQCCCLSHFFCTCHGDWFTHRSSVLNSFFGSKTRDNRMFQTTSIVSWIAFVCVGLRELAVEKKATDRAETCEFLEDKLHEVETELKELREESCWIFQFRCSWTCALLLLAWLIVALLATCWCCVWSCTRRANVVVDIDGSHERGVAPAVRGGGMVRRDGFFWRRNRT